MTSQKRKSNAAKRRRPRGFPARLAFPAGSCLLLTAFAASTPAIGAEASRLAALGDGACLAWDPGPGRGCPSIEEMEASIRTILGRPLGRSSAAQAAACKTTVSGSVRASTWGWEVDLHAEKTSGESLGDRSLELRDAPCSALKEPLSLVVALMVEETGAEGTAVRLPKTFTERSTAPPSGNMTSLSVGGAVSSGLLQDVGFGVSMSLASRVVAGLPLAVSSTFWFPTVQSIGDPGGQFTAWDAGLGFCPSLFRTRRFSATACLRGVAGVIRGVGTGLDEAQAATRPFGSGEIAATLSVRLSRQMSTYLSVAMAASWLRPRFVYTDPGGASVLVHEVHALIPLAALGITLDSTEVRPGGGNP